MRSSRLLLGLVAAALAAFAPGAAPARAAEVCGAKVRVPPEHAERLVTYARKMKLRHPEAAAGTIWHLHDRGALPDCYLTKAEAERAGWRPGDDLWKSAPGAAIGGDNFGNREGKLPSRNRYVEADLDYDGGKRGARRIVFVRDIRGRWLMWVTIDHYRTFYEVPLPSR